MSCPAGYDALGTCTISGRTFYIVGVAPACGNDLIPVIARAEGNNIEWGVGGVQHTSTIGAFDSLVARVCRPSKTK